MKKTIIMALSLSFACLALTSCSSWSEYRRDLDSKPAICKKLKRQMIYNSMNRNTEAAWQTPTQRSHLRQLYSEYDCD